MSMFYGRRDEDYWVKDSSDIDRLVDEVMTQTDYPDRNFVRDTLLEFNFDMVSTVDFILSISVLMNQSEDQPPPSEQEQEQPSSVISDELEEREGEPSGEVEETQIQTGAAETSEGLVQSGDGSSSNHDEPPVTTIG
jgi:hypothetical protein